MEKTIRLLLLSMIITGLFFTACSRTQDSDKPKSSDAPVEDKPPTVEFEFETDPEDSDEAKDSEGEIEDQPADQPVVKPPVSEPVVTPPTPSPDPEPASVYKDGTYNKTGSYVTPGGSESLTVQITLEDDAVIALTVTPSGINDTSKIYQGLFVSGINSLVIGRNLADLNGFGQVNGSSLSPGGFQSAIEALKLAAKNA